MRKSIAVFALALLTAGMRAQQPEVVHSQLQTQAVEHGLIGALGTLERGDAPTWVGYSVPTASSFQSGWSDGGMVLLESRGDHHGDRYSSSSRERAPQDHAIVLFRLAGGKVDQVSSASPDNQLDAGGLRFVWLTGVTPEESVGVLRTLAGARDGGDARKNAVFLIALHRSAAAVPALVALAGPANEMTVREAAAFWLANQRGREGFLAVQTLARTDADAGFREKLTFDLTLSKEPEATDELIRMAHDDPSQQVRRQAQFWMAVHGGKLVTGALRGAADRKDNDEQTREQAVFALSRLPGGEAETQLQQLAETSPYPHVRERAVFWLGQSTDPRALAYLSKLLGSPRPPARP